MCYNLVMTVNKTLFKMHFKKVIINCLNISFQYSQGYLRIHNSHLNSYSYLYLLITNNAEVPTRSMLTLLHS